MAEGPIWRYWKKGTLNLKPTEERSRNNQSKNDPNKEKERKHMKPELASREKNNRHKTANPLHTRIKKWQRRTPGTTDSNQKETSLGPLQEEEEKPTHKYCENVYAHKLISLMEFINAQGRHKLLKLPREEMEHGKMTTRNL